MSVPNVALVPVKLADAEAITAAVQDPLIYRSVGRIAARQSLDATRNWLAEMVVGPETGTNHVFCIKSPSGELLGMAGAHRAEISSAYEIGYWIAPACWGRGLATWAAAALMQHLDATGYRGDYVAGHFVDNPASGRVLSKLGFVGDDTTSPFFCVGRQAWVDHRGMRWSRPPEARTDADTDQSVSGGRK